MAKYVEFPLEGGGSIVIESADEPGKTSTGFMRGEEQRAATAASAQSFDASVEAVRRSADLLVSKLRTLSAVPDEMVVSFALQASGDLGGLAVAKGGSDASFHVTLKWEKEREKERDREREEDEASTEDKENDDKPE